MAKKALFNRPWKYFYRFNNFQKQIFFSYKNIISRYFDMIENQSIIFFWKEEQEQLHAIL